MIQNKSAFQKSWYSIISFVLFSFCINLIGLGNTIFVPIGIILILIYLVFINKSNFFFELFIILSMLQLTYVFFVSFLSIDSFNSKMRMIFLPVGLLILGYLCLKNYNFEDNYLNLVVVLLISMTLYALLCLRNTIQMYGSISNAMMTINNRRMLLSMWNNEWITATGITTYLAPNLSVLPIVFILPQNKYLVQKILIIISFSIATFISLVLANRTGILIIIISFVVSLILIIYFKYYKNLFFILAILLIGFLLITNLFPSLFRDNFDLLYERLSNSSIYGDSRFSTWLYVLKNWTSLITGGRNLILPNGLNYAHNFFLDILFYGGIIPFVFSMWFIGRCLSISLKMRFRSYERILFLLVFVGFFLVFMVEPIMQGWVVSFSCFCFFIGISVKMCEYKNASE